MGVVHIMLIDVSLEAAAQKGLQGLQKRLRERVIAKMEQCAADPLSLPTTSPCWQATRPGYLGFALAAPA